MTDIRLCIATLNLSEGFIRDGKTIHAGSYMGALEHAKHCACAVSSGVFGFFYLVVLFVLALLKNCVRRSTPADKSVSLSKKERKLVFDLNYYLRLQGFGFEHHDVLTSDGYFLRMNRIVSQDSEFEEKPRYPLLLLPGLMQSSSAYCTAGPNAIGLMLSRVGYDVWLGNNRGGFYPQHTEHSSYMAEMWDWSMEDMALRDVPAMVDFVKRRTGSKQVAIGAHSQGTTQTFLALAREEHGGAKDLNKAVSSFSALAPAVFAGPLVDRWFLRLLRVDLAAYRVMIGYHAFMGMMSEARKILPLRFFTYTAYIVFNYMLAWDDALWDRHYRDRNFIFAPVFVSAKLMFWWLGKGGFADRKCIFEKEDTNWFDEHFPPLELYACGRDNLVLYDPLINRIHNYEPHLRDRYRVVSLPGYSHLDVLWARDAGVKVAMPMAEFIWKHVRDKEKWHVPKHDTLMAN